MTADERPLAIDLCTGLGGWATGLVDAGFYVIGVDLEDMFAALGEPKPDHFSLMRQDIRTVHGSQFKAARMIVGSSPCQEFSYRAMPWRRAKALPPPYLGMELFHAQFRIQREASEAAGRHIPMVVENVRGAQPWVGRSRFHYGSYHLWGDVPACVPEPVGGVKVPGMKWYPPDDPRWIPGQGFNTLADRKFREEDGRKVPGFRFDGSGASFQTASVEGTKNPGRSLSRGEPRFNDRIANFPLVVAEGRKGAGAGAEWFDQNHCVKSSNSPARKAASARIAKIPYRLFSAIGRIFFESITTGVPVPMPLTQTDLF